MASRTRLNSALQLCVAYVTSAIQLSGRVNVSDTWQDASNSAGRGVTGDDCGVTRIGRSDSSQDSDSSRAAADEHAVDTLVTFIPREVVHFLVLSSQYIFLDSVFDGTPDPNRTLGDSTFVAETIEVLVLPV